MKNIIAVVVTYNRKKLLTECLDAILNQDYDVNKIILVDNKSTDGTYEYLCEKKYLENSKIVYKKLNANIGGSGGFYEGMKESLQYNPDWVWIMDDDTIPTKTCLKELVSAQEKIDDKISYMASSVYGENGEYMNVPNINLDADNGEYPSWYKYLANGIVKIKEATFVSLLINADAIKKVGLPVRDYFIWGDDTEYTLRLNRYYGNSYFIGNSVAIHKRKIAKRLSIYNEDNLTRINFYFYMIRNNLLNKKTYYGMKNCLKFFIGKQVQSFIILFKPKCKSRFRKFLIIHKALIGFLFKKYDSKAFKNRLDVNVEYKNMNKR